MCDALVFRISISVQCDLSQRNLSDPSDCSTCFGSEYECESSVCGSDDTTKIYGTRFPRWTTSQSTLHHWSLSCPLGLEEAVPADNSSSSSSSSSSTNSDLPSQSDVSSFSRQSSVEPDLSDIGCTPPAVPVIEWLTCNNGRFRFFTWNTRGLLSRRSGTAKRAKLHQLLKKADVAFLQETNGSREEMWTALRSLENTFRIYPFPGPYRMQGNKRLYDNGGLIIVVRRTMLVDSISSLPYSIVGKFGYVLLEHLGSSISLFNLHNSNLTHSQTVRAVRTICERIEFVRPRGLHHFLVFGGDFNFTAPGELIYWPTGNHSSHVHDDAEHGHLWKNALQPLMEVHQPFPTRAGVSWNSPHFSLSRIDRCYISMPSMLTPVLKFQSTSLQCPVSLAQTGISDHVPVGWALEAAKPLPRRQQPIPSSVFAHPVYRRSHDSLCEWYGLEDIGDVMTRHLLHKRIIRDASLTAYQHILARGIDSFTRNQRVLTITRLVIGNDVNTTAALLQRYPDFGQFITITDGRVCYVDPGAFEYECYDARTQYIEEVSEQAKKDKKDEDVAHFAAQRLIKHTKRIGHLWKREGRKLILIGIRAGTPEHPGPAFPSDSHEARDALAHYWSPIFTHVPQYGNSTEDNGIDEEDFRSRIHSFFHDWPAERRSSLSRAIPDLSVNNIQSLIKKCKHSHAGPDGISYLAWKHAGAVACETLAMVADYLTQGHRPHPEFFGAISCFIRKDRGEHVKEADMAFPEHLRPLMMKNTDNKIIGKIFEQPIKKAMTKFLHPSQRGFVPGRQMLDNVVDIDSHARLSTLDSEVIAGKPSDLPMIVAFDFKSAFTMVMHIWVDEVLGFYGTPPALHRAIMEFYTGNIALTQAGCGFVPLMPILSGILQGCTMSGTMFALILDPLLHKIDDLLKGNGSIARACADDIGASIKGISDLCHLYPIFKAAEKLIGLILNAKKVVLVPVADELSDAVRHRITQYLIENLPAWSTCRIQGAVLYLGFYIGPGAGLQNYTAAIRRYIARAKYVGRTGSSAGDSIRMYNRYVVTVLCFLPSLLDLPLNIDKKEAQAINDALHLAPNTVTHKSALGITALGFPEIIGVRASALAVAVRTAHFQLTTWKSWHQALKDKARDLRLHDEGWLRKLPGHDFRPANWDNISPTEYLLRAHKLFPDMPVIQTTLRQEWDWIVKGPKDKLTGADLKRGYASKMDRRITRLVTPVLYPDDPLSHIQDKLAKESKSHIFVTPALSRLPFENALYCASQMSEHVSICLLRSLLNGWFTSVRMSENPAMMCMFGCKPDADAVALPYAKRARHHSCGDVLAHYLKCPVLWSIIDDVCDITSDGSPQARVGLAPVSPKVIRALAIAHNVYHRIKFCYKALVLSSRHSGDFSTIINIAKEHAHSSLGRVSESASITDHRLHHDDCEQEPWGSVATHAFAHDFERIHNWMCFSGLPRGTKEIKTHKDISQYLASRSGLFPPNSILRPLRDRGHLTHQTRSPHNGTLHLFVDGSCPLPLMTKKFNCPAGWAVIIVLVLGEHSTILGKMYGPICLDVTSNQFFGAEVGSNNVGEMTAMLAALQWLLSVDLTKRDAIIHYDSVYAASHARGYLSIRLHKWIVVQVRLSLAAARGAQRRISFHHVKAHTGLRDFYSLHNDLADLYAKYGTGVHFFRNSIQLRSQIARVHHLTSFDHIHPPIRRGAQPSKRTPAPKATINRRTTRRSQLIREELCEYCLQRPVNCVCEIDVELTQEVARRDSRNADNYSVPTVIDWDDPEASPVSEGEVPLEDAPTPPQYLVVFKKICVHECRSYLDPDPIISLRCSPSDHVHFERIFWEGCCAVLVMYNSLPFLYTPPDVFQVDFQSAPHTRPALPSVIGQRLQTLPLRVFLNDAGDWRMDKCDAYKAHELWIDGRCSVDLGVVSGLLQLAEGSGKKYIIRISHNFNIYRNKLHCQIPHIHTPGSHLASDTVFVAQSRASWLLLLWRLSAVELGTTPTMV